MGTRSAPAAARATDDTEAGTSWVSVSLSFKGRKKLVKHLGCTMVGDIIKLHLPQGGAQQPAVVVVDRQGFEIGKEMPLNVLVQMQGIDVAAGALLELSIQTDEFGGL